MLRAKWIVAVAAGYLVLGAPVHAQDANDSGTDADSLDVTITLLPEGATQPDAVTKTIKLPDSIPSQSRAAPPGLGKANDNKDRRAQGLATAEEARAQGSEFGQEMRQQAAEQRANAERGKGPGDAGPPGQGGTNPGSSPPDHPTPPAGTPPTSTPPSGTPPASSAHATPSH